MLHWTAFLLAYTCCVEKIMAPPENPEQEDASPNQPEGLVQMVSSLQSMQSQIGNHILGALKRPGTVAVITSVVPGMGNDQMVSVPLDAAQFQSIQHVLQELAMHESTSSEEVDRRIGFGREE